MKLTFTILMAVAAALSVYAQESAPLPDDGGDKEELHYTYVSECSYNVIHEIDGKLFLPAAYQFRQGTIQNVKNPGDMQVKVEKSRILVQGVEGLDNSFNIVSKRPDKVGFVYELIDKAGRPARFKVVVDADKYVVLLYFYSKTQGEHTFFLAEKKESELERERNHFTPKDKFFIRSYDNLVEKTIVPYFKLRSDDGTDQPRRIEMEEHISFMFNESTVATPEGTFSIKKADTHEYRLEGYKSVVSVIDVQLKGRIPNMMVFLNYKQQIELIEINGTRYSLMP